jgi:tetratricopeptide (TPR) repeat protein
MGASHRFGARAARAGVALAALIALGGELSAQRLRLEQERVRAGPSTLVHVVLDGSKRIEVLEGPSCEGLVVERLADATELQQTIDPIRGLQRSELLYLRWSVRSSEAGKFTLRGARLRIDEREQRTSEVALEVLGDTPSSLGFVELSVTPARIVREQRARLEVDVYFPVLEEPRDRRRFCPLELLERLREPQLLELPWISSEGAPNLPAGLDGEDLQAWVNGLTRHRGRIALAIAQRGLTLFSSRTTIPYALDDIVEKKAPDGREGAWFHMRYSYALRGEAVGKYALGPARLLGGTCDLERGGLVPRDLYTRSGTVELEVVEPPREGRPPEWSGAIGSFVFEAPPPAPQRVELGGEPVRLTLVVRGNGNLAGVSFDLERDPAFAALFHVEGPEVYEAPPPGSPPPPNHPRHEGETWRHFEYRLLPLREGTLELPPIAFAWFDPERGSYERKLAPSCRIEVLPSSRPASARAESSPAGARAPRAKRGELAPDVEDLNRVRDERPRYGARLLFVALAGATWLGVALLGALRRARTRTPAERRRRAAAARARQRLLAAREDAGDPAARLGAAAAALAGYFADRADAPEEGLTGPEVLELARGDGCSAEQLARLARFFGELEAARFGGVAARRADEEIEEARRWLDEVATRERASARRAFAPLLLVALGGVGEREVPEAIDARQVFQRALLAADEERWSDAERDYRELLARGEHGGAVLFNLGNVYARWTGHDAEALACYREAERHWPNDANLASNLDALLARLPGAASRVPEETWLTGLFAWRRDLATGTLLDLATLALVLSLLLGALRSALGARFALGRLALATGILALVLVAGQGLRWRETLPGSNAVMREPAVLRSGPGASFEALGEALPLGSELRVDELRETERGPWVRVGAASRSGWIPRDALVIY